MCQTIVAIWYVCACVCPSCRPCKLTDTWQWDLAIESEAVGKVASTKMWNSLPPALLSCNCPDIFCPHLKTLLPASLFISLATSLVVPLIQCLLILCGFMNFIYLDWTEASDQMDMWNVDGEKGKQYWCWYWKLSACWIQNGKLTWCEWV